MNSNEIKNRKEETSLVLVFIRLVKMSRPGGSADQLSLSLSRRRETHCGFTPLAQALDR